MAAVTISQMLAAEASALADGWTEEQLLDLAGHRLGLAIARFFPTPGTAVGYLGKGHNAGDTLVALRVLRDQFGWKIAARTAFPIDSCAALTQKKWHELGLESPLADAPESLDSSGPIVLLDGLLGSGTTGPLREPLLHLAAEINQLRNHTGARTAAIDLPSGIDPDSGTSHPGAVIADITFMIANAKCGLLAGHAADSTGALALVPLPPLRLSAPGEIDLISPQTMEFAKCHRPFDFHKGMAGRIAILSGSSQYPGAAVLAATGALRAGGGLITLHVPARDAAAISSRCPPEIIVRGYSSPAELRKTTFDSLIVGCGIGNLSPADEGHLLDLIESSTAPTVVDADALNLIARSDSLSILGRRHIITPHPGEFQRLAPDLAGLSREDAVRSFTERSPSTLLLKGARSIITARGQALWCNSTGSPAMATGGQGDLLAGIIGARLAIGQTQLQAATLSAWLCGRAAEIALNALNHSEESLTPSDVANHLGAAFHDWRRSTR